MRLDERGATSVHESGHACLAAVLHIPILEVVTGLHTGYVKPWHDPDVVDPEDLIVMLLAGSRAAFALGEASEPADAGGDDDRNKAGRIAAELGPDPNATMTRLHWRTVALVNEHAAAIAHFANELLAAPGGRLAGDDLQRALERAFTHTRGVRP